MILLITINFLLFSNIAFTQENKNFKDSIKLKKEIDSVLAKYGLKSKGFVINVISLNQKGGQIAYTITNNFYGDTVKNATNFGFEIETDGTTDWVYVYPKKGVWPSPFVGLDSATIYEYSFDPGVGMVTSISGLSIYLEGDPIRHSMLLTIPQGVTSKNNPLRVGVRKKDGFFIFGDFNDDEKYYLFYKGKVTQVPRLDKNEKSARIY